MLLQSVPSQTELASRLERLPTVSRYSDQAETEGGQLATSLAHLEESFTTYLSELLPRLLSADAEGLADALQDIGEELRHIAWHMRDPKYFELFVTDTK